MAVVLITGCSSGFGRATVLRFAAGGDTVVATMRDTGVAGGLGAVADVRALDVGDEASVQLLVEGVMRDHGRIDVVVNNAGLGVRGAVEEVPEADVVAAFDTNVFGPLRVLRAVLPVMRSQGGGVVVNVSSLAGRVAPPFAGIYAATKFALEAVSDALHYELAPFGIRVAVVEPGSFATGFDANRRQAVPLDSPYAELREAWDAAYDSLPGKGDEPPDPELVAAAIVEVARDPSSPLRRLVGSDAELIDGLRRSLDDAAFEQTVRSALGL